MKTPEEVRKSIMERLKNYPLVDEDLRKPFLVSKKDWEKATESEKRHVIYELKLPAHYNHPVWGRFGLIDTIGGYFVFAFYILFFLAGIIALIVCAFNGGHL